MNPRAGAGLPPLMTQINAQIVPNLWFDRQAEEAAAHYIAAFGGNGRIVTTIASHPDSPSPQDVPVVVEFELAGQRFVGINGGPQFTFSEAVSLEVRVAGRRNWTGCGRRWSRVGRSSPAGGSRTSTACPGRSPPRSTTTWSPKAMLRPRTG